MSYKKALLALVSIMAIFSPAAFAELLLVEAEGFDNRVENSGKSATFQKRSVRPSSDKP